VISPDKRFTDWAVEVVLDVCVPATSVADTLLSMAPVTTDGRAFTEAPLFAPLTGGLSVPQGPIVTGKLLPAMTLSATLAKEPYALPPYWMPGDGAGTELAGRNRSPVRIAIEENVRVG
jgi:hypothetical protein